MSALRHPLEFFLFLLYPTQKKTPPTFFSEAIDEYISRGGLNSDNQQFLNLIEDVSEIEYTGDSSQLDLNEIEFFPPGYVVETHYTSIPGMGFGNIAAKYASPFEEKIKLNSKVFEIDDSKEDAGGEKPVIIKYVENDATKTVKAKTVLVTASLGVLKSGSIVSALPV